MWLVNSVLVIACVVIHYEALYRLTTLMPRLGVRHRYRIVLGVLGALVAHAVEVWLFAFAYYVMHHAEGWGELSGNFGGNLMDCAYFSFITFSTVGYGDIYPQGALRSLSGIEALTGFVMITWSASFLYLEMQRYWNTR